MPFFNGLLARISHPFTTATVHSVGLLNVVSTTPARPSVATASHHITLSGFATRPGEKSGLGPSRHPERDILGAGLWHDGDYVSEAGSSPGSSSADCQSGRSMPKVSLIREQSSRVFAARAAGVG